MSQNRNRAFMYGESVFTTMRMCRGKVLDWGYHLERLKLGVAYVYGPFGDSQVKENEFYAGMAALVERETGDKILRLTVYLEQERGLQQRSTLNWGDLRVALFSSVHEPSQEHKFFSLRTCAAPLKPEWWPGFLKAGTYLDTILSQKRVLGPGDDDVLFLSPQGEVFESSVANIFFVSHTKLYTPAVGPQVLAGITRRKVLESAGEFFESCYETNVTLEQLLTADAVFCTNSVRGPYFIGRIDEQELSPSEDILVKLDQLRKRVFR